MKISRITITLMIAISFFGVIYGQNESSILIVRVDTSQITQLYSANISEALRKLKISKDVSRFKNVYDLGEMERDKEARQVFIDYLVSINSDVNIKPDSILSEDRNKQANILKSSAYQVLVTVIPLSGYHFSFEFTFSKTINLKGRKDVPTTQFIGSKNVDLHDARTLTQEDIVEKFSNIFYQIFPKEITTNEIKMNILSKRKRTRKKISFGGYGLSLAVISYGYFKDVKKGGDLYDIYASNKTINTFMLACPDCGTRENAFSDANDLKEKGRNLISLGIGIAAGTLVTNLIHQSKDQEAISNILSNLEYQGGQLSYIYKF